MFYVKKKNDPFVGPEDKTWYKAREWVEKLTVDSGGWRMPNTEELQSLYKQGAGERNMTPLLKTTGWWIWSGVTSGSATALGFSFKNGSGNYSFRSFSGSNSGVFAVRPVNKRRSSLSRTGSGRENGRI